MGYLADFPENEEEIMRVVAKTMREHTQCRVCWHDVEFRFCTEKSSVYEAEFFHEPDEVNGFYTVTIRCTIYHQEDNRYEIEKIYP